VSESRSVKLFCTNKGRHPQRELYYVKLHDGIIYLAKCAYGPGALKSGGPRTLRPVRVAVMDGPKTRSHNIKCVSCSRSPALTALDFTTLLRMGRSEVDISHLR
jgi:hypothetical protein